jgi:hypothetical protein
MAPELTRSIGFEHEPLDPDLMGLKPSTILPFTRLIRGFSSGLRITEAAEKYIQPSEVDRLHDPAIESGIGVFILFFLK